MAIITDGATATKLLAVDQTHKALRTSQRPPEIAGSYRLLLAGTTPSLPAAAATLAALRWGDATKLCLVRALSVRLLVTVASGGGIPELAVSVARAFTASDTGGTAMVMTGHAAKKRSSYPQTQFGVNGDVRVGNGAVLTAGTRTLDPAPLLAVLAPAAVGASEYAETLTFPDDPLVLAQNEGLVVQNVTALVTTGTYRFQVAVEWQEINLVDW
jgi:hypothetical protein